MEITLENLQDKYNSMSNDELAKELQISKVTLVKLLKDAGIPLKGKGNFYNRNKIRVI